MNFFRKHLDSKVSKAIAIVIIGIFLTWEFVSQEAQKTNKWILKVGNIEYTVKEFQESYKILTRDPMSSQEAIANPQYAKKRVLEEMVRNALILQEAESVGFRVNDKMVINEIAHMKIFKGEDGKFDPNILEKTLKSNNLTESEFIRNMKDQLTRNQLMDIFYNTSGIMGKPVYELLVKLIAAEQNITLYSLPMLNEDVKYTDDDLLKYMQENKEKFMSSDEADISIAAFNTNLIDPQNLIVSEDEIKKYYEENATFEPEKRLIQQIVIPSYNDAKQLLESITIGKMSFDDAAKVYVNQQLIPYEIGPFVSEGFDQDIGKIVFALPENGISEVVQTPLGWHIFRVGKVIESKKQDFSQVKDNIKTLLSNQKLSDNMHNIVKDVMADIDSGLSIQEISSKYKVVVNNRMEKSKRLADGSIELSNVPQEELQDGISRIKFLKAIFSQNESGIKLLSSEDNKSFILLHVNNIIPGKLMDFNSVKDQVIKDYVNISLNNQTKAIIKSFRKKIIESKNNKEIIEDKQIGKSNIKFSRLNKNNTMPECIQRAIIDLYQDNVFDGSTATCKSNNIYYFAVLNDMDFNIKLSEEQKMSLKQTVYSIYNEIIFNQFIEHLKTKYPIELDDQFSKYMNE